MEFPTVLCRAVCRHWFVLASLQKHSSSCHMLSEGSCSAPGQWDQGEPMCARHWSRVAGLGDTGLGQALAKSPCALEKGWIPRRAGY